MPLRSTRSHSKTAINKAVQANIIMMTKENEKKPKSQQRPHNQIVAIALQAATHKPKKKDGK